MSETKLRLDQVAQATVDANGNASVLNIGPRAAGERWQVDIFGASGTANAKLQIMRGNSFNPARQLDVTNTASGDSSNTDVPLMSGEVISFWWTKGTPGAVMSCSIQGSLFLPGRRAY